MKRRFLLEGVIVLPSLVAVALGIAVSRYRSAQDERLERQRQTEKASYSYRFRVQDRSGAEQVYLIDTRLPDGEIRTILDKAIAPLFADGKAKNGVLGSCRLAYDHQGAGLDALGVPASELPALPANAKLTTTIEVNHLYRLRRGTAEGEFHHRLEKRKTTLVDGKKQEEREPINEVTRLGDPDSGYFRRQAVDMLLSEVRNYQELVSRLAQKP